MAHACLVLCFLIMQLLPSFAAAMGAKYPTIIIFGDSMVDAGNNNRIPTTMKCNFAPYGRDFKGGVPTGRFSNGRLYTDFLSDALGMKPSIPAYLNPSFSIEDFATGVTFASSGSGYDNFTSELVSVISLWEQLEYFKEYKKKLTSFLGKEKTTTILHEALYIVNMGTNDFLLNYFLVFTRSLQYSTNEYEAFLIGIANKFLKELYILGALKISVAGVYAIGCLPISRTLNVIFGRECREDYNKVVRSFNVKLQNLVANLKKELEGIKLVYSDLYNIFSQIIQKPYLYGFENVREGCCGIGTFEVSYLGSIMKLQTCRDVSKYAFWDVVHPTEKVHRILADHLMNTSLSVL